MKAKSATIISILFFCLSFSAMSATLDSKNCRDLRNTYASELVGNWRSRDINSNFIIFWLVNYVEFEINPDMSFVSTLVFSFAPNISKKGIFLVDKKNLYLKFDSMRFSNVVLSYQLKEKNLRFINKRFNSSITFGKVE